MSKMWKTATRIRFRRKCGFSMSAGLWGGGGAVLDRHDPDLGDSHALEDIHDGDKFLDGELEVGAHDDGGIWLVGFEGGEAGLKILRGHDGVIDFEDIVFIDRNVECLGGIHSACGCGAFRNNEIHAVLEERRGDHENNQQHKNQIEHRGDVQLGEGMQAVFRRVASHAGSEERAS